ncbi:hypothetical protein [Anaerorhabdus sp.]|uniref:hypothetical protein n=2 Tax=Anaerorhabdus sp. TaxID=1872524 RepID=UPI002FC5BF7A
MDNGKNMKIKKLLAITLCLLLVGCAPRPSTSDGTMHAFLSGFKTFDFDKMNTYLSQPIDQNIQEEFEGFQEYTNSTQTTKEVMRILKEMETSFDLVDSQANQVTYKLTITYYSCIELKENYLEYFIQAFDDHANPDVYDQKIADAYHKAYMRANPSLVKTFDVVCIKTDDGWFIEDGDNLFAALTKAIKTQINLL